MLHFKFIRKWNLTNTQWNRYSLVSEKTLKFNVFALKKEAFASDRIYLKVLVVKAQTYTVLIIRYFRFGPRFYTGMCILKLTKLLNYPREQNYFQRDRINSIPASPLKYDSTNARILIEAAYTV